MKDVKRVVSKGKVYLYPRARYSEVPERAQKNIEHFLASQLSLLKTRARTKGVTFDLTLEHIRALLENQHYKCGVSGIAFEFGALDRAHFSSEPWRPSVDRIDASGGYVQGNCRIVCVAVNIALNEWGEEVLLRVSRAVVAQYGKRPRQNGKPVGQPIEKVA